MSELSKETLEIFIKEYQAMQLVGVRYPYSRQIIALNEVLCRYIEELQAEVRELKQTISSSHNVYGGALSDKKGAL